MTLKKVKRSLFVVSLDSVLKDGLAYSEPIMTISDGRIIDNFFTYIIDYDAGTYSGMLDTFGVYADVPDVAYVNKKTSGEVNRFPIPDGQDTIDDVVEQYEMLYEKVRDFVGREKLSGEEKECLKSYLEAFKRIIYPGLFDAYHTIGKSFFDWADSVID